jgi:RNA-directed DNA polymerase
MSYDLSKSSQELREEFFKLHTRDDIAQLLELTTKQLNFHLYVLPSRKKYKTFIVPKKSGGIRLISAPASPIKIIQHKLKQVLDSVYSPKPATHGFVSGRSIVSNARLHKKRRYVLNIDLDDFFPTIHFGRVRGLFMGNPYNLNDEVATVLAQICCHRKILPQGAPTSPTISNMICARLDAKLQQLAKEHQCTYSRYADDITFSTNRSKFPSVLARLSDIGQVEVGSELSSVIQENGFKVNSKKVRLQTKQQRQEVTGLIVNKYPNVPRQYVKQVRAILHAWSKFTLESTAKNYFENYANHRYSNPQSYRPPFQKIILGKIQFIGMVKGKHNPVYLGLLREFARLAPEYTKVESVEIKTSLSVTKPFIYTEGKTDRKHLLAALRYFKSQGLFPNLEFEFPQGDEDDGDKGDILLLQKMKVMETQPEPHTRPHIFMFDRDNAKIIKDIKASDEFTTLKNNVYSLVIPIPKHRENMKEVCIEFYYIDDDIVRADEGGRRLYLSREFNPTSGMHVDADLICKKFDKLKGELKILDDLVFDRTGNNVALSKNNFAENILAASHGFASVDFSGFKSLFERIQMIISDFNGENN